MSEKLFLGTKYYRYIDDDNIEVLRLYKFNETEVKLYNDNNKEDKRKLTIQELKDNYVELEARAVINFCIAKVGNNLDDVIVTMHKMSDLKSNEPTPYCACRQNITDIFANQIQVSNKLYTGCCMSLETCPPDVDYRIMLACNGIDKCVNVNTYMDDTLDNLLDLIKTKDFDRTLEALFADHVKYETSKNPALAMAKNRIMNLESYNGYCKTLRLLLEQNNFMYDFYQSFGIIPVDIEVTYDEETKAVNDKIVNIISNIYQINISATLCLPYWYDIDLEDIQNDYVMILDSNNKLYVVAYVSAGQKHIEIENVESEENIENLSRFTDNRSVKEAMENIRINKNKYN